MTTLIGVRLVHYIHPAQGWQMAILIRCAVEHFDEQRLASIEDTKGVDIQIISLDLKCPVDSTNKPLCL